MISLKHTFSFLQVFLCVSLLETAMGKNSEKIASDKAASHTGLSSFSRAMNSTNSINPLDSKTPTSLRNSMNSQSSLNSPSLQKSQNSGSSREQQNSASPAKFFAAPKFEEIQLMVLYGDKVSTFIIKRNIEKAWVEFSNNLGQKGGRDLKVQDFEYLQKRISKVPGNSNNTQYCPRSYIKISNSTNQLTGCLGATNPMAQELGKIANLLSTLI